MARRCTGALPVRQEALTAPVRQVPDGVDPAGYLDRLSALRPGAAATTDPRMRSGRVRKQLTRY